MELTDQETDTVIAALRFWQANVDDDEKLGSVLATDNGDPLTDEEIDTLIEGKINVVTK